MHTTITWTFAILILGGVALTRLAARSRRPRGAVRAVVGGLLTLDGLVLVASVVLFAVTLVHPASVFAQDPATGSAATSGASSAALGAALATGLACIGAGIAVGIAGAAAIGGITEKPEILGRTLIFVGLAEGIAIYGLIISFMILNR